MKLGKEAAILFSVMFLPGMLAQTGALDPSAWDQLNYHLVLLATAIPQILLVVYLTELRTPGFAKRLGWKVPGFPDVVTLGLAAGLMFGAITILSLVLSWVSEGSGFIDTGVRWSLSRRELLPLVVVSSLAIGYREEIFYRAYLLERGKDLGVRPEYVIAASTLVFAAGHLYQGWTGFAVAAVIGATLGTVFAWRRSLHGIAVAHGLYNAVVLALGISS